MQFARRLFQLAAVYGLIATLPLFFMETRIGLDNPPAITHPEYFYGFAGVAAAWQVLFLIIASDPARYRLAMLPAALEKLGFGAAALVLYLGGRVGGQILLFGSIDLLLMALFLSAFFVTAPHRQATRS